MMLPELEALLASVPSGADQAALADQVVHFNVLNKPTARARALTLRHLTSLYALDEDVALYRVLRRLWAADPAAHPMLALTLALARDPLLQLSEPFILGLVPGARISRADMEVYLHDLVADRLSPASLRSYAQNLNGTWTQAGFLKGKRTKTRQHPVVTPTNLAYALFLAHLEGASGERLFQSRWARLLDRPADRLHELALVAGQRGLLVYRHAGEVTEVRFPDYLTDAEQERLDHE